MPVTEQTLRSTLKESFEDADIIITDLAGDNDHWQVEIISDKFADINRIEQHRLVQKAVDSLDIHALSVKTKAKS
jgi:stress-induced morphogen